MLGNLQTIEFMKLQEQQKIAVEVLKELVEEVEKSKIEIIIKRVMFGVGIGITASILFSKLKKIWK